MGVLRLWLKLCAGGGLLLALSGCVKMGGLVPSGSDAPVQVSPGGWHFSPKDTAKWDSIVLPGKLRTAYRAEKLGQRVALQAHAQSSASMLRQKVRIPLDSGLQIRFAWQVDNLLAEADLADRDREDSPVRLIMAFDGDRSRFSLKNTMLSDLTEALTGEPLPYATLMYVWSNHHPVGSVIINPRTDRVRKLVVESGAGALGQWRNYQRDVRADFETAFGEPPGSLVGLAIMTDADNTRSHARAWYGDIHLD